MNDFNERINSTKSPILICHYISKLIDSIRKENDDHKRRDTMKFLLEKCLDTNVIISESAMKGTVILIENAGLNPKNITTELIVMINEFKCLPHLAYLMNYLLIKSGQIDESDPDYLQHPFIIMLNQNSNTWKSILKEIEKTGSQETNVICNRIYEPLYLYVLCNPDNKLHLFAIELWKYLVDNNKSYFAIINKLFYWMQFESDNTVELSSDLIQKFLGNHTGLNVDLDSLILLQTSCLHFLIVNHLDSSETLKNLIRNLQIYELKSNTYNIIVLILGKTLILSPISILYDLLVLFDWIVVQINLHSIVLQSLKTYLLQWIVNPSDLIKDVLNLAKKIYKIIANDEKNDRKSHNNLLKYHKFISTNAEIFIEFMLTSLIESWKNDEMKIEEWLTDIDNVPHFFIYKIIHFFYGIFLENFNDKITIKTFDIIANCMENYENISPTVLNVMLLKLANCKNSKLHFKILKLLPKFVVNRENASKILKTIEALNNGDGILRNFSTILLLDLWKIDRKYYNYLEKNLIKSYEGHGEKSEFFITKANVLKEICSLEPELHGKELVVHLSKILNECKNPNTALASALALETITILCRYEIIDVITTWNVLQPMIINDKRINVIERFCMFISDTNNIPYVEAYSPVVNKMLETLWEYILDCDEDKVVKAALDALKSFPIDQILETFPKKYINEDNPKTSNWIILMQNSSSTNLILITNFLIDLVAKEITGYLKYIYHVKGSIEPFHYTNLPTESIVKALEFYVKTDCKNWKLSRYKSVYLECLRILSAEFSKPLPPLDWCFLHELLHEMEAKNYCINIASHQVILSGSARRLMENYILALTKNSGIIDDNILIYKNLKYLANSIQPMVFKPFFQKTITQAISIYNNNEYQYLNEILIHLKSMLINPDIQETNKSIVGDILLGYIEKLDFTSNLFDTILDCAISLPLKSIDRLTSSKLIRDINLEWYQRALKIRCYIAMKSTDFSLNLLNELIRIGYLYPENKQFIFDQITPVFKKHKNNLECILWISEFIGQIQAKVADHNDCYEIEYLCDIFLLSIIIYSGFFLFLPIHSMYILFPQALNFLIEENTWKSFTIQILEWLYHMNNIDFLSIKYRNVFGESLRALRNEGEYQKGTKWLKYLNCKITDDYPLFSKQTLISNFQIYP